MIQDTPTHPDAAPVGAPSAPDAADADAGGPSKAPVVDAGNIGSTSANAAAGAAGAGLMSSVEASGSQESGGSPMRQACSSSSGGSSLSSSASIDSVIMNNTGTEGKTQLALIFLLDSSGSVGDGESQAVHRNTISINVVHACKQHKAAFKLAAGSYALSHPCCK